MSKLTNGLPVLVDVRTELKCKIASLLKWLNWKYRVYDNDTLSNFKVTFRANYFRKDDGRTLLYLEKLRLKNSWISCKSIIPPPFIPAP